MVDINLQQASTALPPVQEWIVNEWIQLVAQSEKAVSKVVSSVGTKLAGQCSKLHLIQLSDKQMHHIGLFDRSEHPLQPPLEKPWFPFCRR